MYSPFNISGKRHQHTLSEDRRKTVECASDTHKLSLSAGIKSQHIKSVCRDIMSRRSECSHPEHSQSGKEHRRRRNTITAHGREQKRQGNHSSRHQDLHSDNPPPLALYYIHKRAPKRLNDPRQIQHACKEGKFSIRHTHILEHHHRDVVHHEIRDAFRKIKRRHPCPWISIFYVSHIV